MNTLLAIMNTGNDEDIIEQSIRHNFQKAEKIIVIDNDSRDGTREILEKLAYEYGSRLSLIFTVIKSKEHHVEMTQKARELYRDCADYAVIIDADEFIYGVDLSELSLIPENAVGRIHWKCYIPNSMAHLNFNKEMLYRRDREPEGCHKIVIPRTTNGELTLGNHHIHQRGARSEYIDLKDMFLAHFPVRSIRQMSKKIDFITKFLEAEPVDQSYHLRNIEKPKTLEDLIRKALMYADSNPDNVYEQVLDPL